MSRATAAAEPAALDGEGQEFDTQQCLNLQGEFLSSSPSRETPPDFAIKVEQTISNPQYSHYGLHTPTVSAGNIAERLHAVESSLQCAEESATLPDGIPDDATNYTPKTAVYIIKRNSKGVLRKYDLEGNVIMDSQPSMEANTQKCSMSPTQENPESAYEEFRLPRRREAIGNGDEDDRIDLVEPHDHHRAGEHAKQHSAKTESTGYTYNEDDSGHVAFDFKAAEQADNEEEDAYPMGSQDASFAPRVEPEARQYEPQTPAPPVNPFSQKGSVMKGYEMFGATQPSSVGRPCISPTSTKPSPDIYNNIQSPLKQMASSPLLRRVETHYRSPLQSSVQTILQSTSIDSSVLAVASLTSIQSFNTGLQRPKPRREPRGSYETAKESQERRRNQEQLSDTESDGSISDIEPVLRRPSKKHEQIIQQQLSAAIMKKPAISSRPDSPDVPIVVPSTGHPIANSQNYVDQFFGDSTHDTQQDDIIADSQGQELTEVPNQSALGIAMTVVKDTADRSDLTPESPKLPTHSGGLNESDDAPTQQIDFGMTASDLQAREPSLPLKEVSTNRNDLRTPMTQKTQAFSDGPDDKVPETSPVEGSLVPMADIANLSSCVETDSIDMDNVPGFSQDVAFDNAMKIGLSPDPPSWGLRRKTNPSASEDVESPEATEAFEVIPELPNTRPSVRSVDEPTIASKVTSSEAPSLPTRETSNTVAGLDNIDETAREDETSAVTKISKVDSKEQFESRSRAPRRSQQVPGSQRNSRVLKTYSKTKPSGQCSTRGALGATSSTAVISKLGSLINDDSSQSSTPPVLTPSSSRVSKPTSSQVTRSSTRLSASKTKTVRDETPVPGPAKVSSRRKSGAVTVNGDKEAVLTRSSKRYSERNTKEGSEDPLALSANDIAPVSKKSTGLFRNMAFAVSYSKEQEEKVSVIQLISQNGGKVLEEGFDQLFENAIPSTSRTQPRDTGSELVLSATAEKIGFAALIADEHSRKAKYMQALALGLPCISGRWISACVAKETILDWTPYLLCAGQSIFLGNAIRSRIIQPYSADEAEFPTTFNMRKKLFDGKSILLVMGKGSVEEKRKAYAFLIRIMGPARFSQVVDLEQARKRLLKSEAKGEDWDCVYVHNDKNAEQSLFSAHAAKGGSRKRKRQPTPAEEPDSPPPKKVRVISDEFVVQSLILGQLLED
ncbi:hypothetical protein B7494_g4448 [Chlorociboria aeruginascens]|nr:hypothetical protein B7494_g4448 [Chlorociboria aeruginascens]